MNILLTGATGFLGKQLTEFWLKRGHNIVIACRNSSKLDIFSHDTLRKLVVWQLETQELENILLSRMKPDVIVHAATDYGRNVGNPTQVFWSNEAFPMTLLEQALQHKISMFINLDTFFNSIGSKYQYLSHYTLSKRHFQEWAQYSGSLDIIRVINLKLFHIFGPGDNIKKYVPMLISRCLTGGMIEHTDGRQQRDFIYSQDVVQAVDTILHSNLPNGYHKYEVGRGEAISLRNFAQIVNGLCGSKATLNFGALPTRKGEPMHACADIAPLKKLGWIPQISLEQGLSTVISMTNIKQAR